MGKHIRLKKFLFVFPLKCDLLSSRIRLDCFVAHSRRGLCSLSYPQQSLQSTYSSTSMLTIEASILEIKGLQWLYYYILEKIEYRTVLRTEAPSWPTAAGGAYGQY